MAPLVFNRADAARRRFERAEAYLASDGGLVREQVYLLRTAALVDVGFDPEEIVWSETPGGGREMAEMVLFCAPGAIVPGDLLNYDARRWEAVDVRPGRLFGGEMGDDVTIQRVFGASL